MHDAGLVTSKVSPSQSQQIYDHNVVIESVPLRGDKTSTSYMWMYFLN